MELQDNTQNQQELINENNIEKQEEVEDIQENETSNNVESTADEMEYDAITLNEDSIVLSILNDGNERVIEGILKEYPCNLKLKLKDRHYFVYKCPIKIDVACYYYISLGIQTELHKEVIRIGLKDENGPREVEGDTNVENLTPLPSILFPIDDERVKDLRDVEDQNKLKGLYNHLYLVRTHYEDVNIQEIANFINRWVFEFALPQEDIDGIVKKVNSINLKKSSNHSVYKTFDEYEEREVEWLFYPYIPLGAITILAGDPGCGKSHLSVSFASIVSNGGRFPFEDENTPLQEPSMVVMQNGEDGIEDVIKPRLTRAGANHENVGVIVEEDEVFTLSDLEKLELVLEYKRPKLVIFDPIQRYLGNINPNSLVECTNMLKGVSKLAQKYSCAILVIMHLNKGQNKGIYKLNGSVGLPGTARSVLMVRDLEDTEDKALVQIKSNLAKKGMAIIFEITDKGVVFKEQVPESSLNVSNEKGTKISQKDIAKDFIIEILKNGELESTVIKKEALNNSIAPATLERAKAELSCVKSFQRDKKWFWKLKEETSDNHMSNDDNKEI